MIGGCETVSVMIQDTMLTMTAVTMTTMATMTKMMVKNQYQLVGLIQELMILELTVFLLMMILD